MANSVSPLVVWGGIAAVAAAGIIAYASSSGNDPPKGTCELEAAGVGLILTGLSHGESARAIAGALGGVGASVACNAVVDSLKEDPAQFVSLTVNGTPETVTADRLGQLIADSELQHSLACLEAYGFGTQGDLDCLNYQIIP